MNYLLDTNACIALINGKPTSVRLHFRRATDSGSQVFVSTIAAFELWYGVSKSAKPESNRQRVEIFLSGPISLISFDETDGQMAGSVRAALENAGKPIGAYDVLIAGQALQRGLTLVTANVSEFSRVQGLQWQDWAKD